MNGYNYVSNPFKYIEGTLFFQIGDKKNTKEFILKILYLFLAT